MGVVDTDGGEGIGVATSVGWPTHLPGLLGPAVAALAVTALAYGRSGVADLGRRLVRWRVGWRWWAAVPAIASLAVLSVLVLAVLGHHCHPLRTSPATPASAASDSFR